MNNSIQQYSFICTLLNGSKYSYTSKSIQASVVIHTHLNHQIVLFQTIQCSMSFVYPQFKCQTVLFEPYIGPCQVLLLQVRVNLGAIAMKGYITLLKYPRLTIRLFNIIPRTIVWGGHPSAEMQLVDSTAPANWAHSSCVNNIF